MKLYNYYRSSASFRVRIALNLKSLKYEYVPVHLIKNGGENHRADYRKISPIGEVPCLVDGDFVLTQSMAILTYLDEAYGGHKLFPADVRLRARVVELCEMINSGTQPLHNVNVTNRLRSSLNAPDSQITAWIHHYISRGLTAVETKLKETAGSFCFGGTVTAADVFLAPQVVSAKRFAVDLAPFPTVQDVFERLMKLEAFQLAEPSRQPDAE